MPNTDPLAEPNPLTRRILSRSAWVLSAFVAISGLVVLTGGWLGGVDALRRIRDGYAAMAPSTALCFCLCGALVLWELAPHRSRGAARLAGLLVSGFVGAIALANLAVIATSPLTGLDALLFSGSALFDDDYMATATSACFLLAALAHACAPMRAGPVAAAAGPGFTAASTLGLAISLVALIGYLFDARALYAVSPFTAMALHTALGFAALFASLLLSRPAHGWVGVLTSAHSGGRSARRLIPAVVLGPLALTFLTLLATRQGLLNADFRLALLAVVMIAALTTLVLMRAVAENANEAALTRSLARSDQLLAELNHRMRNHAQLAAAILALARREAADDPLNSASDLARRVEALGAPHFGHTADDPPDQLRADAAMNAFAVSASRTLSLEIASAGPQDLISLDFATRAGLALSELCALAAPGARRLDLSLEIAAAHASLRLMRTGSGSLDVPASAAQAPLLRDLLSQLSADLSVEADDTFVLTVPASVVMEESVG